MSRATSTREVLVLIGTCSGCDCPLPLCEPADGLPERNWMCNHCEEPYAAALHPDYHIDDLWNIRPSRYAMGLGNAPPPTELIEFLRQMQVQKLSGVEKRSAQRHAVNSTIPAVILDRLLVPVGAPFLVASRDISTRGIGLLSAQAITAPFCAVEFQSGDSRQRIQVVTQVIRCRPRGPYYDVAGEFVTKTMVE